MTTEELKIWKRLNKLKCVEKAKGNLRMGDNCLSRYDRGFEIAQYVAASNQIYDNIWIPPLYNPIRPERSLIGIARGIVSLRKNPWLPSDKQWVCEILDSQSGVRDSQLFADRPDLALAQAIIEQEAK
jgi:hypothetical protein